MRKDPPWFLKHRVQGARGGKWQLWGSLLPGLAGDLHLQEHRPRRFPLAVCSQLSDHRETAEACLLSRATWQCHVKIRRAGPESVQADWVASRLLWKCGVGGAGGGPLATLLQICTWLPLPSTLWYLSFHVVVSGGISSVFYLPDPHPSLDPEQSCCCQALCFTDDTHQAA